MATILEDFEDTTYNITVSGSWTRTSEEAHGGTWSMRCATPPGLGTITHTISIPAGATSMNLWSYGEALDTDNGFSIIVNGVAAYQTDAKNAWEQSPEVSLVGATTLQIEIGRGFSALVYWVDDIRITVPGGFIGWGIPIY